MALDKTQLAKLPPSVAQLLQNQSSGDQQLPAQSDPYGAVTSSLTGALGRRFGEGQDFDQGYFSDVSGLLGQVPQIQNDTATQRQRMGEVFNQTAEQLDRQNTQAGQSHLASMADRGMGYSGANLLGQEKIGQNFLTSVQGANKSYRRGLDDLSTSTATALKNIQMRQQSAESAAAGRATARDETRKWEMTQQKMQQDALKQQQSSADSALKQQQAASQQQAQEAAQWQQQMNQMMQQAAQDRQAASQQRLADSQPMPTATGSYAPASSSGGSSGFNADTNVSFDYREYNLRDPNEIKSLQSQLGLRSDGIIGPATIQALQDKNAVYFNDRPIDTTSRGVGYRTPQPTQNIGSGKQAGYKTRSGRY